MWPFNIKISFHGGRFPHPRCFCFHCKCTESQFSETEARAHFLNQPNSLLNAPANFIYYPCTALIFIGVIANCQMAYFLDPGVFWMSFRRKRKSREVFMIVLKTFHPRKIITLHIFYKFFFQPFCVRFCRFVSLVTQ